MTTELIDRPVTALPFDPIARAIADVEGLPEPGTDQGARTKELTIVSVRY